jgi:glucan phosphoethanolaminetransferase (alkaline phosphatase superfamily)
MPKWIMLHRFKNHLLLGFIFFILSLAQQYGFYALKGMPIVWLTFGKYFAFYFFLVVFSFTPNTFLRFGLLSFLLLLNFFQMAHLSYFGTLILPTEIYLFFAEFQEITGTVSAELHHILIPLAFTLVPLMLGYLSIKKWVTHYQFKLIPILVALYFCYNPMRTFITGNTWGRQPSTRELAGMNMYLSLSYFAGKILPSKLEQKRYSLEENESLRLKLTKRGPSVWDNIIVILGESLSPDHMSLYRYQRSTTPFLESLKTDPHFFATKGLSSGVSTDISVAFFLNMGYGEAGGIKAAKGEHCHFRLAKKNGFTTHFLSTQSSEQLRYIAPYLCSAYLDDYRSLEQVSPETENANAAIDRHLIPKLMELLKKKNQNFIMLHQRGSHGPWELRSTPESKKFKEQNVDQRINDYDNSVVEFDLFWSELHRNLKTLKTKTLVLYLSDHGEAAGRDQRFGHGFLAPSSFEIPMLFLSYNQKLPDRTREIPAYFPQYNFSLYLARQIGWETNQNPFTTMTDYMIYGNDIDGFAGKAEIKFTTQNSYIFKVLP